MRQNREQCRDASGPAPRMRSAIGDERQDEAGEGYSHAPGRYPSPASLAGASRHRTLAIIPKQAEGDITLPDPPRPQGSPKEWQNSASRIEFFIRPHEFNFAHLAARSWHGQPKIMGEPR